MTCDYLNVPIFIQSFNQVSYLRTQIDWMLGAGYQRLIIIDNASTYPALLQYYDEMKSAGAISLYRRHTKDGKFALWTEGILGRFGVTGAFAYTDSDVVPDTCCPSNVIEHLINILRKHPSISKAGLGLRIDDLPQHYRFREEVMLWEEQYWQSPLTEGLYLAPIDTTFAVYRPGAPFALEPAIRTGWPYIARHEPWYANSTNPSEEEAFYTSTLAQGRGHWGRHQLPEWLAYHCDKIRSARTSQK